MTKQSKPRSEEHRQKLKEAAKRRWERTGPMPQESRDKIANHVREKWKDPEWAAMMRRRQSEGSQGKKPTEEAKAKMSEKAKARWADPEFRDRTRKNMSEGAKKRWADPEKRRQLLKAQGRPDNGDPEDKV